MPARHGILLIPAIQFRVLRLIYSYLTGRLPHQLFHIQIKTYLTKLTVYVYFASRPPPSSVLSQENSAVDLHERLLDL